VAQILASSLVIVNRTNLFVTSGMNASFSFNYMPVCLIRKREKYLSTSLLFPQKLIGDKER
jgi:hypothetical protein